MKTPSNPLASSSHTRRATYQVLLANLVQIDGQQDLHELLVRILPGSVDVHSHLADIQRLRVLREGNVAEEGSAHEEMDVLREQIEQGEEDRRDVVVRSDQQAAIERPEALQREENLRIRCVCGLNEVLQERIADSSARRHALKQRAKRLVNEEIVVRNDGLRVSDLRFNRSAGLYNREALASHVFPEALDRELVLVGVCRAAIAGSADIGVAVVGNPSDPVDVEFVAIPMENGAKEEQHELVLCDVQRALRSAGRRISKHVAIDGIAC